MKKISTLFIFCLFILNGTIYSQCATQIFFDDCTGATLDVGASCQVQVFLNQFPSTTLTLDPSGTSATATGAGASALTLVPSFAAANQLFIVDVTNSSSTSITTAGIQTILTELGGAACSHTANFTFDVLPVELLKFAGRLSNKDIELEWATASETNNEKFIVERSFDGNTFEAIEVIPGAGTSFEIQNYSFVDNTLFGDSDIVYYRLSQKDFDGEATVLTDAISFSLTNDAFAFNRINSNGNNLSVSFSSVSEENVTLSVIDISGKILAENVISAEEGYNMVDLDINAPLNGIYILKLRNDKEVLTQKFLK